MDAARTRRKSKEAKDRAKMGKQRSRLDARQYMFGCLGCFAVSWAITATVLLLNLTFMYAFNTVVQTRSVYSAEGAAEWARVVAEKDIGQAYEVFDLLNTSLLGLVYREPEDYTNLASVLAPAFDTLPALHSIQFAFSDRLSELYVSKRMLALSNDSSVLMQSTSSACFLLGPDGCVEQMELIVPGTARPQWYLDAERIPANANASRIQWASEPQIVVETNADSVDFFSLCVRLLFVAPFPQYEAEVLGQIMIKLPTLSGGRLTDDRLGEEGKIMLVDANGLLLASRGHMDVLRLDEDSGKLRVKQATEVDATCGSAVESASSPSGVIAQKKEEKSDELVIVEPLRNSMDGFAVVVKAPSVAPFTNSPLLTIAIMSAFVGPAPYVLALAAAVFVFGSQCIVSLRHVKDASSSTPTEGDAKRVSIADMGPPSPMANPRGWLTGFYGAELQDSGNTEPKTPTVQGVRVVGKFAGLPEESVEKKAVESEKAHAAARMNKVMRELELYEREKKKKEAEKLQRLEDEKKL